MSKKYTKVVDGYTIPTPRPVSELKHMEFDESGEKAVLESFTFPLEYFSLGPVRGELTCSKFEVWIRGEKVGISRVELPTLDAHPWSNDPPMVTVFRAKVKSE